jgi:hypothetical protein
VRQIEVRAFEKVQKAVKQRLAAAKTYLATAEIAAQSRWAGELNAA